MAMTEAEFLKILKAENVKNTLSNSPYIASALKNDDGSDWSDFNIAALLHANGITYQTSEEELYDILMTWAAFHKKDHEKLAEYIAQGVTAGVRLDYFLPLYSAQYDCGEDIFVCAVKCMVGGDTEFTKYLPENSTGIVAGVKDYVNNAFIIRNLLINAPNKTPRIPTPGALEFILERASSFKDSNKNPVIVFIPGVIDVPGQPVTSLIEKALANGGRVNDLGFFNVSGMVWSIIMGDVEAVRYFINKGAQINTGDEITDPDAFGNHSAMAWATATLKAVKGNAGFEERMKQIIRLLKPLDRKLDVANAPEIGFKPEDYLSEEDKGLLRNKPKMKR